MRKRERELDGQRGNEVKRQEREREKETRNGGMLSAVHVIHFLCCKIYYLTLCRGKVKTPSVCVSMCVCVVKWWMDNLTTLHKTASLAFSGICMIRTFFTSELYVCGCVWKRQEEMNCVRVCVFASVDFRLESSFWLWHNHSQSVWLYIANN